MNVSNAPPCLSVCPLLASCCLSLLHCPTAVCPPACSLSLCPTLSHCCLSIHLSVCPQLSPCFPTAICLSLTVLLLAVFPPSSQCLQSVSVLHCPLCALNCHTVVCLSSTYPLLSVFTSLSPHSLSFGPPHPPAACLPSTVPLLPVCRPPSPCSTHCIALDTFLLQALTCPPVPLHFLVRWRKVYPRGGGREREGVWGRGGRGGRCEGW